MRHITALLVAASMLAIVPPSAFAQHLGVDFGGGVEYFFTRRATLVAEGLFHKVGDVATPGALFHTGGGSFFSATGGVKKYF